MPAILEGDNSMREEENVVDFNLDWPEIRGADLHGAKPRFPACQKIFARLRRLNSVPPRERSQIDLSTTRLCLAQQNLAALPYKQQNRYRR